MKRSSLLVVAEVTALVAAVAIALLLPKASVTAYDLLWFLIGLSILKLSDVWLPRGDAIGMSAALALGALLLFDARVVLAILFTAEVLAMLPRGRSQKWQMALGALAAEAVAVAVCSAALIPPGLHPSTGVLAHTGARLRAEQYFFVLLVGLVFAALEYCLLQLEAAYRDRRPMMGSILGSLSYGGWLIAAQASAGVLASLTYRTMAAWGLVVSVVMILVMRQSFVLLLDIRQAYDATIDVLIKAMEAQRPGHEGVAARNATLSVEVGRVLGMHGRELERVRYAALLLGLGPTDQTDDSDPASTSSSRIIEDVEFLADVAPILRLCDAPTAATGVHRSDLACSYLVMSVASATGVSSSAQLRQLRDRVSPRIVREVDGAVSALIVEAPIGSDATARITEAL